MQRYSITARIMLTLPALLLAALCTGAVEMVSSHAQALSSVSSIGGYSIIPAGTEPGSYGDLAPIQLFEITKPDGQSFTISRMFTSCTCVQLEADKRTYGQGEKAILRLRNIIATPPGGMTYALYVQFANPSGVTLRYDTFVQSSQFVPAPDGAPPTRGNIVADGVLGPAGGNVEVVAGGNLDVIVPKAENYIPDTSEYTLRKQKELKKSDADTPDAVKDKVQPLDRNLLDPEAHRRSDETSAKAPDPTQRPKVSSQLHNDIDSAISRVERTLQHQERTADGQYQNRTQTDYSASARANDLTTNQERIYQTEARQIGQAVLATPAQPAKPRAANQPNATQMPGRPASQWRSAEEFTQSAGKENREPHREANPQADGLWREPRPRGTAPAAGQDEFWSTPRPRGTVRPTASFSQPPIQQMPSGGVSGTGKAFPQSAEESLRNRSEAVRQAIDAADSRAGEAISNTVNDVFRTSGRP